MTTPRTLAAVVAGCTIAGCIYASSQGTPLLNVAAVAGLSWIVFIAAVAVPAERWLSRIWPEQPRSPGGLRANRRAVRNTVSDVERYLANAAGVNSRYQTPQLRWKAAGELEPPKENP